MSRLVWYDILTTPGDCGCNWDCLFHYDHGPVRMSTFPAFQRPGDRNIQKYAGTVRLTHESFLAYLKEKGLD